MTPSRTNTAQGTDTEKSLQDDLPAHPRAFAKVKEMVGIPADAELIDHAENVGLQKRKADAVFNFGDNHPLLRVSVKSFSKGAGYNQIERKSLASFCKVNRIAKKDEEFLQQIILRKAKAKKGKRTHLVQHGEEERVKQIFSQIEVGASSLLGQDHPQIFAIYSREIKKWHLYDMQKQVLPVIRQRDISFTPVGRNVRFGIYVDFKRKGSKKGEDKISGGRPFTDIRHRSNDVQIMIRSKRFFNEIEPLAYIAL